jgi:hypothetical protein
MKNNMKKTSSLIATAVVIGLICFYAGMKYGQGSNRTSGTPGQVGLQGTQQSVGGTRRGGFAQGGGFTAGEILSKDTNGITVKLRDGSSKIIILSPSTAVMKEASGTANDLTVGQQVTIMGSQNTDGSVTAQSVQIRPVGSMPVPQRTVQ